jgi:hypothetical protein
MFTLAQQKAIAIVPKFVAALSIAGSSLILLLILRTDGSKRNTYHRLILGLSLADLSSSIAWFMTTWPVVAGTPGSYGAVGTQETCSAQGFFTQFSIVTVMYNASLAVYYVLVIVKGWKDADIAKIEPYFHLHALSWGFGTSIASLALGLFNPKGWDCWISPAPSGCKESWENGGVTTCERGDNASLYQWAFFYAPLWAAILLVTVAMVRYHCNSIKEEQIP